MSTTSMAILSNPLFATYSVYARNASIGDCCCEIFLQTRCPYCHTTNSVKAV